MVRLPPKTTRCWLPSSQFKVMEAPSVSVFSVVMMAPFAPIESFANGVEVPMPIFPFDFMLKIFCAVEDATWKKSVVVSCVSMVSL